MTHLFPSRPLCILMLTLFSVSRATNRPKTHWQKLKGSVDQDARHKRATAGGAAKWLQDIHANADDEFTYAELNADHLKTGKSMLQVVSEATVSQAAEQKKLKFVNLLKNRHDDFYAYELLKDKESGSPDDLEKDLGHDFDDFWILAGKKRLELRHFLDETDEGSAVCEKAEKNFDHMWEEYDERKSPDEGWKENAGQVKRSLKKMWRQRVRKRLRMIIAFGETKADDIPKAGLTRFDEALGLFNAIDRDYNGEITRTELRNFFKEGSEKGICHDDNFSPAQNKELDGRVQAFLARFRKAESITIQEFLLNE